MIPTDTDVHKTISPTEVLPLEMWRRIFEQLDVTTDLMSAVHLCKHLQFEAEAVLYRNISLRTFPQTQRLADTLKLSTRRATSVRGIGFTFTTESWPRAPRAYERNQPVVLYDLADEAIHCINSLLKTVEHLQMISFTRSITLSPTTVLIPRRIDRLLEGCTFRLRSFSWEYLVLDDGLLNVCAQQPTIEELNIFPMRIRTSVFPGHLLPSLRKLHCDSSVLDGLRGRWHSIRHLMLSYDGDRLWVDRALELFGRQLVTLSLDSGIVLQGSVLPFTESASIELPCLDLVELRVRGVAIQSDDIVAYRAPIDIKNFHPPRGPIRTWRWHIQPMFPLNDGNVGWRMPMARLAAFILLEAWPTLENFIVVCATESATWHTIYSRSEGGQLVEQKRSYPCREEIF